MGKSNQLDEAQKQTRKYQKIDKEQRKEVLRMLNSDKLSLQEVASRLGLKYCTIRTIQKAYENEGRIGKKETRKKRLKVESTLNISIINPFTLQVSQPVSIQEVSQVFMDKQPNAADSITLMQTQQQLLAQLVQQLQKSLAHQLQKQRLRGNMMTTTTIQNMFIGSQVIFKQLFENKPANILNVKQEIEPFSPTPPQAQPNLYSYN